MSFSHLCCSAFLLSLVAVANAKIPNTEFAQKVRSNFPQDTFKNLFNTDHDSVEQFLRALAEAEKVEADIVGITYPASLNDKLEIDVRKFADTCTPESLFRIYVNAAGETLEAKGVMNGDNMDEMAKQLAKFLDDEVETGKKNNVEESVPALSSAVFKFFESLDLATEEVLRIFTEHVLNLIKMEYS